jgi:hypothetical protein
VTYNIGTAPVQKIVGRGLITSYRQHQLIIVGYLQQCPHFETETSHYLEIAARSSAQYTVRMTDPFRLPVTNDDHVRVNLTLEIQVPCQHDTSVTVLFTKTNWYSVCTRLSDTASWLTGDDASDLYLESTLAALTSCPWLPSRPEQIKVKTCFNYQIDAQFLYPVIYVLH